MRRLVVACLLCALTTGAGAQGLPASSQPQSDGGRQQSTEKPQSAAQAPIIVNVQPPAKTEAEAQKEESERKEKANLDRRLVELTGDLADYTRWLAYATAALFAVTAGLFVFAIRQARDAKEAGRAARDSANAAERSVVEARDDRRPWVGIDAAVTDGLFYNLARNQVEMRFKVSLSNSGRSVAERVTIHWRSTAIVRNTRPDFSAMMETRDRDYVVAPDGAIAHIHIFYACPIECFETIAALDGQDRIVPVLIVRASYASKMLAEPAETIVAFSVYRRNEEGSLPVLTIADKEVPASRLYVGNEGGTAT